MLEVVSVAAEMLRGSTLEFVSRIATEKEKKGLTQRA
jgi:hypothetical protein